MLPLVCVSVDYYIIKNDGITIPINDWGCYSVKNDTSSTQVAGDADVSLINLSPVTLKANTFQESPYQSIGGKPAFIPTKTQAEWMSFVNNPPPGIIRYSCCAKTCI